MKDTELKEITASPLSVPTPPSLFFNQPRHLTKKERKVVLVLILCQIVAETVFLLDHYLQQI